MSTEYPKINSLWKREAWYLTEEQKKSKENREGRNSFIVGDYACPEFCNIKTWTVTEKVDGTNIRIIFSIKDGVRQEPVIMGKTSAAVIQPFLLPCLQKIATWENIDKFLSNTVFDQVVLYGEGYGPKIQACGANYRDDPGFILFDATVDGVWLCRSQLNCVAIALKIAIVPILLQPLLGCCWTEEEIVEFVKDKPDSICSIVNHTMEGVVAKSYPTVYFADRTPVMFKLKCREF